MATEVTGEVLVDTLAWRHDQTKNGREITDRRERCTARTTLPKYERLKLLRNHS